MTLYDDMQGVFAELAPEFSQGVIRYIDVTPGAGKLWKPGAASEVATVVKGFARGVSTKFIMRGLAVAGDNQVTFPGGSVVPDMDGYMEIDGVREKIVNIIKKPNAGTVVAWTVITRKGAPGG